MDDVPDTVGMVGSLSSPHVIGTRAPDCHAQTVAQLMNTGFEIMPDLPPATDFGVFDPR